MRWRHQIACGIVLTLGSSAYADEFSTAAGYYATGQWREAIAAFDRLMMLAPQHPQRADAEFFRAEAVVQLHDYELAAKRFQAFLDEYPDHALAVRAWFRLGECQYLNRQWSDAIDSLRRFIKDSPKHELTQYALPYLGFALLESGDHSAQEARLVLEESANRDPRGSLAELVGFRLIELDAHDGDVPSMRQRLAALQQEFPNCALEPEYRYWCGIAHQLNGEAADALKEFAQVAASDAKDRLRGQALFQTAQILIQQGDEAAALDLLERLESLETDGKLIELSYVQRIRILTEQKQLTSAKSLIEAYQRRFPSSEYALEVAHLAGEANLREQDFDEAIGALRQMADADANRSTSSSQVDQAVTWYQLARAYYQAGDYAEALAALDHVEISGLPAGIQARVEYARGSICQQLQRPDEASAALLRALAQDPKSSFANRVRWKRTRLLTQEQQWDEAFGEFREWQPEAESSWFYRQAGRSLAESAYLAGRYELASSVFALLLSHLSGDRDAAYGLSGMAWCYLQQENWQTAVDLFSRVTEQFDGDVQAPTALLGRAYCLEKLGDLTSALDAYRQFIRQFAGHPECWRAYLKAAELLRQQRAYTDAVRVLEEGLNAVEDDETRDRMQYLMAWLRRQLGQDNAARELFRQIHDRGPASRFWSDATYRLAQDAFARHENDEAERWITQILQAGAYGDEIGVRPYALYLRARIAAKRADWQEVLTSLDDLQVAHPDSPLFTASQVWSVEVLYRLGDYDNVQYRLDRLRQGNAPLKPAWQRLLDLRESQVLAEHNQWESALDRVRWLADNEDHDKRWAEANLLVARGEIHFKHYDQARGVLQKLVSKSERVDGDTIDASWCLMGDAYQGQDQYELALKAYLQVRPREESQWYGAALLGAAKSLERTGHRQESVSVLQRLADSQMATPYRTKARELLDEIPDDWRGSSPPQLPVSTTSPRWQGAPADQKGNR